MTDFNLALSQVRQRLEILYQIVDQLEQQGGGSGGTDDYTQLNNKPKINNVTLTGNKTSSDLGLASAAALNDKADKSTTYTKEETQDYVYGEIIGAITNLDVPAVGGSTKYITTVSQADGLISATAQSPDTVPVTDSTKLITSGGVKTYADSVANQAKLDAQEYYFETGTAIPSGSDFNDYTSLGIYTVGSNSTAASISNIPATYGGRLEVIATIDNSQFVKQIYTCNESDGLVYTRRQLSTGWSSWTLLTAEVVAYGIGTALSATTDSRYDLNSLQAVGRYNYGPSAVPYIDNMPSGILTSVGGEIIVERVQLNTRLRQTLYLNSRDNVGKFWVRQSYSGSSPNLSWSSWYVFEGTEVTAPATLQSMARPVELAEIQGEENEPRDLSAE